LTRRGGDREEEGAAAVGGGRAEGGNKRTGGRETMRGLMYRLMMFLSLTLKRGEPKYAKRVKPKPTEIEA